MSMSEWKLVDWLETKCIGGSCCQVLRCACGTEVLLDAEADQPVVCDCGRQYRMACRIEIRETRAEQQ